ncbi:collagen alpha-1(I) chain [Bos taurus]|uniref:collagen alpha-1(I) chain n=1 Tax=Bos taurus TaxID=9913 RepID=UPI000383BF5C|nr:collagen alpha-1(I) chain-like [Bos taurus]
MDEGERGGRGPEGGTPSVLRHPLSPLASHPLYTPLHVGCGAGGRGWAGEQGGEGSGVGKAKKCPPSPDNSGATSAPPPVGGGGGRCKKPPGRPARRRRRASVAFPSPPPSAAAAAGGEPRAQSVSLKPPLPAPPARLGPPPPTARRTLSNPLGSRRLLLLREETLAAAEAGAARLGRRGARYGEPSNGARADAQRRRVLAEHGRGAAAAVAAGAQGPLHHWQPWSPSIFLPPGRRLSSAHVLGEEGAGARASPEGGGTCAEERRRWCEPLRPRPPQPVGPLTPAAPAARAGGGRRRRRLLSRRRWWPDGAGAATAADAVQRNERLYSIILPSGK